jgi:RNA polymerase sigma-70 factor (ECF subfamily)
MRLVHWRILNELRRRGRRPASNTSDDDAGDELADLEPGPEERAWQTDDSRIVQSALAALPPKQRQAVSLAFLEDLTHEQVARALDVPLGTAKTRIRSGLSNLRVLLAPVAASLLAVGLAVVGVRLVQTQSAFERDDRALRLVTTSELVPLRLIPPAGSTNVTSGAHANYRGRAGENLMVLTTEALPTAPAGRVYQAWALHGGHWTSLGTFSVDANGGARLIAEDPALATPPETVEITIESDGGSGVPSGPVVLAWPSAQP